MRTLSVVTPPNGDPISVYDLKSQSRIYLDDEDALLIGYVKAATGYIERITSRQLLTARYRYGLDRVPCEGWVEMPKAPLRSVVSVTYTDSDGNEQTWAPEDYESAERPGFLPRLRPKHGKSWPAIRCEWNAIRIEFETGYGTADQVPAELRVAIAQLGAHWAENREPVVVGGGVMTSQTVPDMWDELIASFIVEATQRESWHASWTAS